VRRQFEALRLEERWLHGQRDGTDLDLDRAIMAWCDLSAGQEPDPCVFLRWQRQRQPVALLVLVDLSGSTQGHVVHLEQEALVLLSEGLRVLRFPHALFGFHDDGAEACWLERLKGFGEGYEEPVLKRIANLQPGGATRLGAFLRHGALLLARRPEERRVLLVLSDGKPDGHAPYQGTYGVRDSAMAVQEGARLGVHTFCVSLDAGSDAPDYLSRIFGPGRFLALANVDQLPVRLPDVLRRLVR
jgi:nitric oxide reductase NorD protein